MGQGGGQAPVIVVSLVVIICDALVFVFLVAGRAPRGGGQGGGRGQWESGSEAAGQLYDAGEPQDDQSGHKGLGASARVGKGRVGVCQRPIARERRALSERGSESSELSSEIEDLEWSMTLPLPCKHRSRGHP
jgi:hypothetical protein